MDNILLWCCWAPQLLEAIGRQMPSVAMPQCRLMSPTAPPRGKSNNKIQKVSGFWLPKLSCWIWDKFDTLQTKELAQSEQSYLLMGKRSSLPRFYRLSLENNVHYIEPCSWSSLCKVIPCEKQGSNNVQQRVMWGNAAKTKNKPPTHLGIIQKTSWIWWFGDCWTT